jgi:hypothetical protein
MQVFGMLFKIRDNDALRLQISCILWRAGKNTESAPAENSAPRLSTTLKHHLEIALSNDGPAR